MWKYPRTMGRHWRTKEEAALTVIAGAGGLLTYADHEELIRAIRILGGRIVSGKVAYHLSFPDRLTPKGPFVDRYFTTVSRLKGNSEIEKSMMELSRLVAKHLKLVKGEGNEETQRP